MSNNTLGKEYKSGEVIIHQGDAGNCMYVIQEGEVEVIRSHNGNAVRLAVLGRGEFFGEISLFEKEQRSATVRALGDARIMTVDKKVFLRRIQEDLTLAFRVIETMATRINTMNAELVVLKCAI